MGSVLRDAGASGTGGRSEGCHAGSGTSIFSKTVHRKLRQEVDHFQASLNYQSDTKKKGRKRRTDGEGVEMGRKGGSSAG